MMSHRPTFHEAVRPFDVKARPDLAADGKPACFGRSSPASRAGCFLLQPRRPYGHAAGGRRTGLQQRRNDRFLVIEPSAPFRLDLTAWALRRPAHNAIDRFDGSTYRRVVSVGGGRCAGPTPPIVSIGRVPPAPEELVVIEIGLGARRRPSLSRSGERSNLKRWSAGGQSASSRATEPLRAPSAAGTWLPRSSSTGSPVGRSAARDASASSTAWR
jgi:hypothetical protein